jgi:hypothetical protein
MIEPAWDRRDFNAWIIELPLIFQRMMWTLEKVQRSRNNFITEKSQGSNGKFSIYVDFFYTICDDNVKHKKLKKLITFYCFQQLTPHSHSKSPSWIVNIKLSSQISKKSLKLLQRKIYWFRFDLRSFQSLTIVKVSIWASISSLAFPSTPAHRKLNIKIS